MGKWPELTKQEIKHVDATPDKEYPLRILKAYRQNCDVRWATGANGECDNPLFSEMNEHCERRAKILDNAIKVLENAARECELKSSIQYGDWRDARKDMPTERDYYLCYLSDANGEKVYRVNFFICESDGFGKSHKFDRPVIAWMPLPEPPNFIKNTENGNK